MLLAISLLLNVNTVLAATNSTNTTKVSISQLTSAASSVNTFYKTNKRLPSYVTISGQQITMPQFLYLLASGTSQLNSGSTASILIKNVNLPAKPVESLTKGNIQKTEYVNLAKSLKKYADSYGKLPNYLSTSRGKMKFESTVDMLNRVMIFYKTNHRLPSYVAVTPWTGKNYTLDNGTTTSYPIITVTPAQLDEAASNLKTFIDNYNKIPTTLSIAGQKIYISQFLQLLAQRILNIYNGKSSTLTTQKIYMATTPVENLASGNIQKTEYINLVRNLTSFSSSNNKIPNYLNTTLGKMRYESATYLLLKVLTFYNTNNRLPSYIYISHWTGTTTPVMGGGVQRPVYIISDLISNPTTDKARIDAIVNGLKNLGLSAYNYGAGTNNIEILKNTNIPINGLIVEICGGACAATIYEMGTSWYENLKNTKKVFLVFTDGATKITGLDWLQRAHDDNFSPDTFTGLANPDQYLTNHGYGYYEGYTSSRLTELVQILYKQATS